MSEILELLRSLNGSDDWWMKPEDVEESDDGIVWDTLDNYEIRPVEFADKPLFQFNTFHLLVGQKNSSKGTYLAYLASQVTRGEMGAKSRVVWISLGEDSYGTDVKPRMIAAGGYPHMVTVVRSGYIHLPRHAPAIARKLRALGDVGLVIVDPISGVLPPGTSSTADTDVRSALAPLNQLADDLGAMVVGVRHVNKGEAKGLSKVLGSVEWVNVPRVILGVGFDAVDPRVRHIHAMTGNRLPIGESSGRRFRVEDRVANGCMAPLAVPDGESFADVSTLLDRTMAPAPL